MYTLHDKHVEKYTHGNLVFNGHVFSLYLYHISLTAALRTHFDKNRCVSCGSRKQVVQILKVANLSQRRNMHIISAIFFADFGRRKKS
jgi:hypothetical protein